MTNFQTGRGIKKWRLVRPIGGNSLFCHVLNIRHRKQAFKFTFFYIAVAVYVDIVVDFEKDLSKNLTVPFVFIIIVIIIDAAFHVLDITKTKFILKPMPRFYVLNLF